MSCYFSLYLHNKASDTKILLYSYASSEAREIGDEFNLIYGEYAPFSVEMCEKISSYFKNEIENNNNGKMKWLERKNDAMKMVSNVQNLEVFNELMDEINECNKMMEFVVEENERLEFRYHEFRVFASMMEDASYNNENEFEYFYG